MGEVYRAKDTRLERTVAVKVLPSHLSSSPETRQRFEREAKTISQLSHPHICALHDVGSQDGIEYLVMELLEGETLAARLARGALPLEQTLRYGQEIADALDKAHRQGIVHRDLKPGNVMLTKSGVKLLDFGLAKAIAPPREKGSLTSLPTQQGLTQEGTILGTFQYMAPEQLEGKEADARTDIFAFGTVLYEMATGKKAFSGASQASLISSIMTAEPPSISAAQPMSPPALDRVVKTCLAKDPEDRWQSAADVGRELKWIAEGSAAGVAAPRVLSSRRRLREVLGWIFAAVVATVALFSWRHASGAGTVTGSPLRFDLDLPAGERLLTASGNAGATLRVAPDGGSIVYVARQGASWELRHRNLRTGETKSIPGTLGALDPFFSPDGRWIAFTSEWTLRKVALSGGTPVEVSEVSRGRGGSWGADGTIYFAPKLYGGISRVSQDGGAVTAVTELDKKDGEKSHRWPELLPGGKALIYAALTGRSWDEAQIVVKRLDTGDRRVLIRGGTSPHYAPTGHLVYGRGAALYAVPFDLARLAVTGQPVEVTRDVYIGRAGSADAVFTASGTLVFIPATSVQNRRLLTRVDRQGVTQTLTDRREEYTFPRVSPDGSRAILIVDYDLFIFDIQRRTFTPLMSGPRTYAGVWTADGKRVVFASEKNGPWNVFSKPADGSAAETEAWPSPVYQIPQDVSSDGRSVLVQNGEHELDVFDLATGPKGKGHGVTLVQTGGSIQASFSPDGRWVAYGGGTLGQPEVFVVPAAGGEGKWQISNSGGAMPRWNRSGKEIFYLKGEKLMTVPVKTGSTFEPGVPQELFSKPDLTYFDVFPDGEHFLLVEAPEAAPRTSLGGVANWFSELSSTAASEAGNR
jgi:serine/threonine-protein kinase